MDSGMFLPVQLAAAEALMNPPEWYEGLNAMYTVRRKIAESILKLLKCSFDPIQVGLFVWGRIPDVVPDCKLLVEEILNKAHVFITPGFIFGSNGDRYIRISLCADEKKLREAGNRIESLNLML